MPGKAQLSRRLLGIVILLPLPGRPSLPGATVPLAVKAVRDLVLGQVLVLCQEQVRPESQQNHISKLQVCCIPLKI